MKKELLIHWATDNKDSSMNMVLLYAYNAKRKEFWDEITLLIWGASQNLVKNDQEVSNKVKEIVDIGVKVIACQHCAKEQNTTEALESCNIDIFLTGAFLTQWTQENKSMITI